MVHVRGAPYRSRLMMATGEVKDHGIAFGIKSNIFHIDQSFFGAIVVHQRRTDGVGQRRFYDFPACCSPCLSTVVGLDKVEVCTLIHITLGVHVEGRDDPSALRITYLVMPTHTRQFLVFRPFSGARVAHAPVQLSDTCIFREEENEPVLVNPPWLRIGELSLGHMLKGLDVVGQA